MLSCKELAQQHASDYIDRNLSPSQRLQVGMHLLVCGHCRRFVKKLKITKNVLSEPESLKNNIAKIDDNMLKTLAHELRDAYQSQASAEDSSQNK